MSEKMPVQLVPDLQATAPTTSAAPEAAPRDWRQGLPVLRDKLVTLRELEVSDAPYLFSMLSTDEVRRYMTPPPPDIEGFERFIAWARAERAAGRFLCYGIIPAGYENPVGLFQVRQIDPVFTAGEWGAALGSQFWGTGLFESAARMVMDFLFDDLGVHRLEARAAVQNGRANGAARKIGAVPEGVARQGLNCRGRYHDQLMWSILAEDWLQAREVQRPIVH
jgi:RimJ/RimL family protein N-acetyltransferase